MSRRLALAAFVVGLNSCELWWICWIAMVTTEIWITGPPLRSCSLYALKGRDKVWGMALISSLVSPPLPTADIRLRGKESSPSPISPSFRLNEDHFRLFEIVHWRTTVDRRSSPTVQGVSRPVIAERLRDDVVRRMRRS